MTPLRLLDLFSGVGGFSLGLERSGAFRTGNAVVPQIPELIGRAIAAAINQTSGAGVPL